MFYIRVSVSVTMSIITERKRKDQAKDLDDKAITSDKSDEGKKVQVTDGENMPGEASNEDKRRLLLAVHFSNVLYASSFWIQIGVYPVRKQRTSFSKDVVLLYRQVFFWI